MIANDGSLCRVMVVDDDPGVRRMLAKALEGPAVHVTAVCNGQDAIRAAEAGHFDAAITDIRMPGMDGHELLRHLKVLDSDMDVIVITAHGTIESAVGAMHDGAADYLTKPFSLEEIRLKLERIRRNRQLREENRVLRSRLRESYDVQGGASLIGASPSMQKVYRMIEAVAGNRSNVLVQGETGTGKELVAKAIHNGGSRAAGPLLALTCACTSKSLLESQLFGHVKGAFTGAARDNPGFFVAANGGTLFLDEITEVDTETQVKLLRALQEREVTPVGGTKPVPFDARIIAATNRDARRAVEEGTLRQDLYYRLSVVVIPLPPLRERKEDIHLLIDHFNARLSGEYGLEPRGVSEDAMEALLAYDWPGNVRELENVVERAFALGESPIIALEHLPQEMVDGRSATRRGQVEAVTLSQSEEEAVRRALDGAAWNKSEAARRLGVDRKRLYRLIRKYGITEAEAALAGQKGGKW